MIISRTGILIGGVEIITFYGIIITLGAVAAAWLIGREAQRRKQNSEIVWDGLIWVLIGGIVGARLWHVFTPPPSMVALGLTPQYYLTHPLDLINTRMGGLGIPGGIIGGALALYLFCRNKKISFALWADMAVPGVALGQAIGRWGNFVNQEVYGARTTLPWGIRIDREGPDARFHPLFLYEALWNLLNMGFLLWVARRYADRLKNGDIVLFYLIIYPVGRFCLEFLRLDAALVGGLNINQTVSAVVALIATVLLIWRHRKEPKMESREVEIRD
jgi:phosphatidylglycerol---prolipoprotein diacylglyceryl transferase